MQACRFTNRDHARQLRVIQARDSSVGAVRVLALRSRGFQRRGCDRSSGFTASPRGLRAARICAPDNNSTLRQMAVDAGK